MLLLRVNVTSRILSPAGKFPIREYEHPAEGCTKFMYSIQYRTPATKQEESEYGDVE